MQFTLVRPDFGPNFDKAVIAFEERQHQGSETLHHHYFLLKEGANAMQMNFALFEPKVSCSRYLMLNMNDDLMI